MKRILLVLTLLLSITNTYSQDIKADEVIFVSVESKCIDKNECHTVEDLFHEYLLEKGYIVRTFSDEGKFADARKEELIFQESGEVAYEDVKSTQKMLAAGQLMVIVIERIEKELYFRVKFFDLETGRLIKTARYPNANDDTDTPIKKITDIRRLEKVTLKLLNRLGLL